MLYNKGVKSLRAALSLALAAFAWHAWASPPTSHPVLERIGTIPMTGVEGRFDHFSFDEKNGRVFVAALENHSLEVVDAKRQRRMRSLGGLKEPQAVVFAPGYQRLLVTSRGDGTLRSFDAHNFVEGGWADFGRSADNVRYDATSGTVYVGSKSGKGGAIDAVDVRALVPVAQGGTPPLKKSSADLLTTIPRRVDARATLTLGSPPESFQLDPPRHRMFVNLPEEGVVAVVDLRSFKVAARWPVPFKDAHPLAFSAARDRVFVGCRQPPRLLVYRASDGALLSQQPCAGDTDDLYYDGKNGRLYLIGGSGEVNVFDARADRPQLLQTVKTGPRARTGTFLPSLQILAVAVPHTPAHRAEIRLFKAR